MKPTFKSFSTTISFGDWAAALPRWLLRSRTPFAAYLAMTFRSPASRCGLAPATATFPLPCPRLGLFGRCAHGLPHAQKQRLYLHRVVHIVVAALNFVHDCGRWAPRHLLWREPNASQKACFGRVRSFVVACFSRKEEFPLPPGRSGPDLVARLLELETFAGAFGLVGSSCTSDLLANFGPVPGVPPSAELPQLQPYRSLDVSRLRLHGTGSWHIAPFLEGSLWLPFQEPNILRHGLPLGTEDLPDFEKEDAEEHLKLALLWDARGLLQLAPPLPAGEAFQRSCRIFNSYKSPEADRQIGDRRPANKAELHLPGPSQFLPQGNLLTAYRLPRRKAQLTAYVSDRRDFYHQVAVSRARADCNRLPFAYPAGSFKGTSALADLGLASPPVRGHGPPRPGLLVPQTYVPAFRSLLQGDHLGVEFALEGHSQLLAAHHALLPAARVQGSAMLPLGPTWQALVIDDLVAAPLGRRVALAVLSLRAARLPITSPRLLSRLSGAWVSCAMFRRCSMCIFHRVFGPESRAAPGSPPHEPVPQPRKLAQEFCLASALLPLFASNIAVHQHSRAFATDASLALGAFCETEVGEELAHSLWLNGDRKGAYSRLSVGAEDVWGPPAGVEAVPPSLPFVLDLLEIGHPLGPVSAKAVDRGLRVGPPIHCTRSPHYAIEDPDFFAWLYAVLKEGRVLALVLHPPVGPLSVCCGPPGSKLKSTRGKLAKTLGARCLLFFRCPFCVPCPASRARCLKPTPLACLEDHCSGNERLDTPGLPVRFWEQPGKNRAFAGDQFAAHRFQRECCCSVAPTEAECDFFGHLPLGLVEAAADSFAAAGREQARGQEKPKPALESVLANDLLAAGAWRVRRVLKWKGAHHINVLELSSLAVLLRELALEAPDSRISILLDSAVAKAAAAKGRSTSFALAPGLARACALQLAYGLYMSLGFAPTRLNIADDPTRFTELRPRAQISLCKALPTWALHGLGARRFSRPLASWSRLFLIVLCAWGPPSYLVLSALGGAAEPSPTGGCPARLRLHTWFPRRRTWSFSFSRQCRSPLRPTKLFCRERSWSRLVFFLLAARPLVGSSTFAYTTALLRLPPYLQPTLDFLPRPFLDFPV